MSSVECLTPLTGFDVPEFFDSNDGDGAFKVGVIIPAYNEEKRLAPTLDDVINTFDKHYGHDYRVTVVDDGSDDDTKWLALAAGARVIELPHRGKGNAVRTGMLRTRTAVRLFMDADGSFKADDARRMIDTVAADADIAIAVRNNGIDTFEGAHASKMRALGSRATARLCARYAPVSVSDTQCGMKAFKGPVAHDLFSQTKTNRFALDREVLFLADRENYRIAEMPVRVEPKEGSKVRPIRDGIRLVRDARRIRKLH